jgi:hypothetical protein
MTDRSQRQITLSVPRAMERVGFPTSRRCRRQKAGACITPMHNQLVLLHMGSPSAPEASEERVCTSGGRQICDFLFPQAGPGPVAFT